MQAFLRFTMQTGAEGGVAIEIRPIGGYRAIAGNEAMQRIA
jgi:hypothetical protein